MTCLVYSAFHVKKPIKYVKRGMQCLFGPTTPHFSGMTTFQGDFDANILLKKMYGFHKGSIVGQYSIMMSISPSKNKIKEGILNLFNHDDQMWYI